MTFEEIIQNLACSQNQTPEQIIADMQTALDAAWEKDTPTIRKMKEYFHGEKPSVEIFTGYVMGLILSGQGEDVFPG